MYLFLNEYRKYLIYLYDFRRNQTLCGQTLKYFVLFVGTCMQFDLYHRYTTHVNIVNRTLAIIIYLQI